MYQVIPQTLPDCGQKLSNSIQVLREMTALTIKIALSLKFKHIREMPTGRGMRPAVGGLIVV